MTKPATSIDDTVARRLRVVRKSKNLSQRELARRAGVGSGTISSIESMSTQPSVSVLKKILDGIPMDLATFFSFELQEQADVYFPRENHIDIGTPGVRYNLIAANVPDRKMQMIHEFYEPGKTSGRRHMAHEGEECGVVIRGTIEVTIGDDCFTLHPGDAYYFNSEVPHKFRNIGRETCEVVSACTPPTF